MAFGYISRSRSDKNDKITRMALHSGTDLAESHIEKCATRLLARSLRSARRSFARSATLRFATLAPLARSLRSLAHSLVGRCRRMNVRTLMKMRNYADPLCSSVAKI